MTQTERIDVRGTRIAVRRIPHGDGGAPTIVFLHEGLGSISLWKDFPGRLAAACHCGSLVYSRFGNYFIYKNVGPDYYALPAPENANQPLINLFTEILNK